MVPLRAAMLVFCLTAGAGCGGGGDGTGCLPGDMQGCACPSGSAGYRVCIDDGARWSDCWGCGEDGDAPADGDMSADGDDLPDGDDDVRDDAPADGDAVLDGDEQADGDLPPDGDMPFDGDEAADGDTEALPDGDGGEDEQDEETADGDPDQAETESDGADQEFLVCALPDAGPDRQVDPLETVTLDGSASTDPAGSGPSYRWEWVSRPPHAAAIPLKDTAGNPIAGLWTSEAHPTFWAVVAGSYIVSLAVRQTDAGCVERTDLVEIRAIPSDDIHLELTWDTGGRTDQDLHLIRPGGTFSRGNTNNRTDCHWTNCNTARGTRPSQCDWGETGVAFDDPRLDLDDISTGNPEVTNLDLPETGIYRVAVEYYSGSLPTSATVDAYLFGVLWGSFSMQIGAPNFHWNVCEIHVESPDDIFLVPIGTVEASGN